MDHSSLWLIYAFLAPLLLSLGIIVNKWMVTKYIPDTISMLAFMLLSNILFVVPASFFGGIQLPLYWLVFTLGLGVLYGLMFFFNLTVLKQREASHVAILLRLKPLMLIPLAAIFLHEILPFSAYLGIVLLALGGAIAAAKEVDLKRLRFSKALGFIFIQILISSFVSLGRKHALTFIQLWPVFYWFTVGNLLAGVLLIIPKSQRINLYQAIKNSPTKVYVVRVVSLLTYLLGLFANTLAVKHGPVTVVSGIYSIQPLVILIYASLISLVWPQVVKEDLRTRTLFQKLISIFFVITGSLLIIWKN